MSSKVAQPPGLVAGWPGDIRIIDLWQYQTQLIKAVSQAEKMPMNI